MKNTVYLDYAATTPVDPDALKAATPYFGSVFFNPASQHAAGQAAARAVDIAREQCARAINAAANEIYFTSGGTEAVNLALKGYDCGDRKRVVISGIEHDCALACCDHLHTHGVAVDRVMPNADGIVTPDALEAVMRDGTSLVCVMSVNNITGAIQPVAELAAVAHAHGARFMTDAVQAVNSTETDVDRQGIDLLAASAHKFYGMKGAGFLYVRSGIKMRPVICGGEQENGLRGGTLNVPAVVAMGAAIEKAVAARNEYREHIKTVREEFSHYLHYGRMIEPTEKIDDIRSVIFDGVDGGRLAVALSCAGVCCSVGSACSAGSAVPPVTLINMGVKNPDCSVRFSFGRGSSVSGARRAARIVNETVEKFIKFYKP